MDYDKFFIDDNKSGIKCRAKYLETNYPDVYNKITSFSKLNGFADIPFTQQIWYFIHGKTKPIVCVCGNQTKFTTLRLGFFEYCSKSCGSKASREKAKETTFKRFGVDNAMKSKEIKDKVSKGLIERYGVDNIAKLDETKAKVKQTTQSKYGVDNVFQSEEIKDKIRKTNIYKYGSECVLQSDEIKKKSKETIISKYGVENIFQSDYVKDKIKDTLMIRYGVDHVSKIPNIIDKQIQTNLERYGVEYPMQNPDVLAKANKTNIEKYGVERVLENVGVLDKLQSRNMSKYGVKSVLELPEVKDKIRKTSLERYGVESPIGSDVVKQKIKDTLSTKYGVDNIMQVKAVANKVKETMLNTLISKQTDRFVSIVGDDVNFFCSKCNMDYTIGRNLLIQRGRFDTIKCTNCNPVGSMQVSSMEIKLGEFIQSLGFDIITNSRALIKPYEIDIYVPELKVGFEFNGLYWHSDKYVSDDYHLNKTILASNENIKLIQIFEDEWVNKNNIVKSRIKQILKVQTNRVYARKTQIKIVSKKETYQFLRENHIQGSVPSKVNIGLYYNDELVSIMTFGSLRNVLGSKHQDNHYELLRFCNKLNTSVVGGANKLFKYFIKNYDYISIISYADKRWSIGGIYEVLGFDYVQDSKPNYSYLVKGIREHRYKYRKSSLVEKGYDKNLTERQIMADLDIPRIYDCGNMKFIYNKD